MSELKRSDKQYVEVEEFADYELTQCIVYEMAIRDSGYRKLADKAIAFYDEHKEDIDWYFGNCTLSFVTDENYSISDAFSNVMRSNDHLMIITQLKFMLIGTMMVKSIDDNILNIEEQYRDNRLGDKFWDIVEMFGSEIIPDELNEQILEQGASTLTYQEDTKEIQLAEVCERDGYSINTALVNSTLSHKDAIQIQSIEDCAKHFETYVLLGWRGDVRIEENFKRPLLKTNSFKVANPKLTVNLSRPLKEIIALITHIKEDIDKNNLIKLPIELLGESLEVSDAQPLRKKLADKFFVYDYVKARLEQIEKFNDETKKTFSEEVQQIKDNDNFSDEYKKYLINNAKEELKDGLYSTNINEIFDDEELKSVVSQGTAKRYYYEMKSYIEDKKYKELITGTHT